MNCCFYAILPRRLARLAVVPATAVALFWAASLLAADATHQPLWLISTRRAPVCAAAGSEEAQLDYWRLGADQQWLPADRDAFLAEDDPAVPTSVFIHGNRMDSGNAVRMGRNVYRQLAGKAPEAPFRFVIWSWPAERIRGGRRRDVRVKADRSDLESYYLARCVDRIDPRVPVSMVGYSFGARVITGALQILGGGRVAGRGISDRSGKERVSLRAVLVAGAMGRDWLLPGRRNGLATRQLDRLLITRNARDPVLRWYPLMNGCGGPQALGYAGPVCAGRLGEGEAEVEVVDVTCSVGRAHDWASYLASHAVQSRLAEYAFLEPPKRDAPRSESGKLAQ